MKTGISATIICHDEEKCIADCIRSLRFCDEIIVVDSFSSDRTVEIASSMGAKVTRREFQGYRDQKEFAASLARGPWIVNLDADEEASEGLGDELRAAIDRGDHRAFSFRFRTFIAGRRIRFGRFWGERHVRAFLKGAAHYDPKIDPHEKLLVEGTIGRLESLIFHHAFADLADAQRRSNHYAALAAKRLAGLDEAVPLYKVYLNPAWRFFKEGLLKLGFLDGAVGLRLAVQSAREAHLKYEGGRAKGTGASGS